MSRTSLHDVTPEGTRLLYTAPAGREIIGMRPDHDTGEMIVLLDDGTTARVPVCKPAAATLH